MVLRREWFSTRKTFKNQNMSKKCSRQCGRSSLNGSFGNFMMMFFLSFCTHYYHCDTYCSRNSLLPHTYRSEPFDQKPSMNDNNIKIFFQHVQNGKNKTSNQAMRLCYLFHLKFKLLHWDLPQFLQLMEWYINGMAIFRRVLVCVSARPHISNKFKSARLLNEIANSPHNREVIFFKVSDGRTRIPSAFVKAFDASSNTNSN